MRICLQVLAVALSALVAAFANPTSATRAVSGVTPGVLIMVAIRAAPNAGASVRPSLRAAL
jgi:hypothetical protein